MCPGVPHAVAAKLCSPERPSIAFVGDGAIQMLGNNGLLMLGDHGQEWSDPRLVIAVLDKGDLNQVTREQRVMEGDPKYPRSQDVAPFDHATYTYAAYARSCGLAGIRVSDPEEGDRAELGADSERRAWSVQREAGEQRPPRG